MGVSVCIPEMEILAPGNIFFVTGIFNGGSSTTFTPLDSVVKLTADIIQLHVPEFIVSELHLLTCGCCWQQNMQQMHRRNEKVSVNC